MMSRFMIWFVLPNQQQEILQLQSAGITSKGSLRFIDINLIVEDQTF